MILIRPRPIGETLISNIAEADPGAWNAVVGYAEGARVSVASGSTLQIYKSLADGNVANDPAVPNGWWAVDGVTYAEWDAGITYAAGDRVISEHRVLESLANANINHPLTDPAWWMDVGPSNRWAMFDSVVGTATAHPFAIEVEMPFSGRIDSLALLGLANALSARIVVSTSGDGIVYDRTFPLISTDGIGDWYNYFFEDVSRKAALLVSDLPAFADPTVKVTIEGNGSSPVECGVLSIGLAKDLGVTLADGAQVGITDYSRKVADDFGNYSIVERAFSRRGSFRMRVPKSAVDGIQDTLAAYRATPAVYAASPEYGATLIYGFFRDFNIEIDYPTVSLVSLEIEGLT